MGRHTLKFGWSTTRAQVNDLQSNNNRGALNFNPDFGRTAMENFLLGTPDLFTITIGNLYRGFRNWEHAAYVEDEFRISPAFSINMGVRYELETSPTEVNNLTDPKMPWQHGIGPRLGLAWNPGRGRLTVRSACSLDERMSLGIRIAAAMEMMIMPRINAPPIPSTQGQTRRLRAGPPGGTYVPGG